VFCYGTCFHDLDEVASIAILVGEARHPAAAIRMPRVDVLRSHPDTPRGRSYRSGFWATVPIPAREAPGIVELRAAVRLAGGHEIVAPLGRIQVVAPEPPAIYDSLEGAIGPGTIAVCMATYDPDPALFRIQVDSLRAQTHVHWVCLVSDDCSSAERSEQMRDIVGDDARFVLSRSEKRLGFYRNFERALKMVPADVTLVALCDQDDRWYPEKLEVLRGALGEAQLVYSDQRLTTADGRVMRDTLWQGRGNNHTNLASLLVANTITGAATLFRREVAELAVPFPDTPGLQFHDHWLGLVALATGELAYVDRPLYDYVQHAGAVFGEVTDQKVRPPRRSLLGRLRGRRGTLRTWRGAYFLGYLSREVQAQALLARCSDRVSAPKARALRRFAACQSSPAAFAWLALRSLRLLAGRDETLGSEIELSQGIAWRWLAGTAGKLAPARIMRGWDATFPDPMSFGQKRMRGWRARV
jgi:glycosyltransferase involved in cell wall biosynthesis